MVFLKKLTDRPLSVPLLFVYSDRSCEITTLYSNNYGTHYRTNRAIEVYEVIVAKVGDKVRITGVITNTPVILQGEITDISNGFVGIRPEGSNIPIYYREAEINNIEILEKN